MDFIDLNNFPYNLLQHQMVKVPSYVPLGDKGYLKCFKLGICRNAILGYVLYFDGTI